MSQVRAEETHRIGAVWRSLVALGLGLVFALMLDQTIRWFVPPEPIAGDRPRYLKTVQYHPILAWSGFPNFAETNDGIRYQTNSRGYRDREPVAADGQKLRVLFLGDSFTWGDEVSAQDRFPDLLEASCGSHCDHLRRIHAINRGIIGYGTAQELLQYLLTRNEQPFDMVILSLFSGNDLTDNASIVSPSGPRPRLIRCDSGNTAPTLCLEGVPVPTVVDWPEHRLVSLRGDFARSFGWSGLVTMATQRRAPQALLDKRVADQMGEALTSVPFRVVQRTSNAAVDDRIGQLEDILRAFDQTVRADGKGFGVLVFPSARVYAGKSNEEQQDYREILGVLNRLNIPFADFYKQTKDTRWQDLFFDLNSHWRRAGHEEAAELLRTLLASEGMRSARPARR